MRLLVVLVFLILLESMLANRLTALYRPAGAEEAPLNGVVSPAGSVVEGRVAADHAQSGSMPFLVPSRPLPVSYQVVKRSLDVLVSGAMLLLLLPVFLLIALAVRLSGPGPVLYRSTRVGRGGRRMTFLKFRTMYADAETMKVRLANLNQHSGPIFKARNDPRITPVGKFLRKFSLDELPQLLHVLMGDMTLVGPRPHLPCEVERYRPQDWARLAVKPGLTCYWQIRGRSDLSFDEWVALDLEYIRDMGLLTDLRLLAATPRAVLGGKGAY